MRRFFFHIEDGESFHDDRGLELESLEEARKEAVAVMSQYLRDRPGDVWADQSVTVTVQDEKGLTLFCVITSGVNAAAVMSGSPSGSSAGAKSG